jgi:hypothetical protein
VEPAPVAALVAPGTEVSVPDAPLAPHEVVPAAVASPVLAVAAAEAVAPADPVRATAPARAGIDPFPVTWAAAGGAEAAMAVSLLSGSRRIEPRAATPRAVVEPLQQMVPPGERRGARILTAMVSMAAVEGGPRATDRVASRLSEERLYDQIERFGARGAGVNVRF